MTDKNEEQATDLANKEPAGAVPGRSEGLTVTLFRLGPSWERTNSYLS